MVARINVSNFFVNAPIYFSKKRTISINVVPLKLLAVVNHGMGNSVCETCGKSKAALSCGCCSASVCKYCAQILEEGAFSYLAKIPAFLSHQVYCGSCFDRDVATELQNYNDTMERAKEIQVFFIKQSKEVRLIKRPERKPFHISDCADHDETVMRLAFLAAQAGYNALIEVDVNYEKVRNNSYQTHVWSGTGLPCNVEARRLMRDRTFTTDPN